ncbi:MAG: N-acetylglucosamine-6-phosphate deacetylase [Planctomycetes bacterium]|nr:N-acetylglucosamine-6-phosphate deacetylase [Planctomycetota bacterium]
MSCSPSSVPPLLIVGGRVLMPERVVQPADVLVEAGRISQVAPSLVAPDGARVIDAKGLTVAPGFVDLHVHGGAGADFMDATPTAVETITRFHAAGGTAAMLATTASSSFGELLAALDNLAQSRGAECAQCDIVGVHLEGPYFAQAKRGCHLGRWVRDPAAEEYETLLERYDFIGSMTLAPELPGALELVSALAEAGAVPSAGHSDATAPEVRKAIDQGLRHVTHLYSAMSTITKDGPYRIAGLLEATLLEEGLTTEVIADGRHAPRELVALAVRCKGPERLCLVTDAMRGAGMPDGIYTFGGPQGLEAVVRDGVAVMPDNSGFASSTVRMVDLVRNMVNLVGVPLPDALRMASTTPASVAGVSDRKGTIEPGKDADLVLLDADLDVAMTVCRGRVTYQRDQGVC